MKFSGRKLKNARLSKGLSQGELGELVHVKYQHIQRYESGRVVPGPTMIRKLSLALDKPIDDLYDQDEIEQMQTTLTHMPKAMAQLIKYASDAPLLEAPPLTLKMPLSPTRAKHLRAAASKLNQLRGKHGESQNPEVKQIVQGIVKVLDDLDKVWEG